MSLQELFDMTIEPISPVHSIGEKWSVSYQYKNVEFEGYLDDDKRVNLDHILWSGAIEDRTQVNFPIVPTTIRQQAHVFGLGYQYSPQWSWYMSVPYIKQSTDHISIIADYENFTIDTGGVGDTVVTTSYLFHNDDIHKWWFSLGVSLPTGSIDKMGDTPRDFGDQPLPYTMQLGSGTFDFPMEFHYQNKDSYGFGLSLTAMIRSGKNDQNYRLGNNYQITSRYRTSLNANWDAFATASLHYSSAIKGQDNRLLVDGAYPYPASITNPHFYGGKKVNIKVGLAWKFSESYRLTVELGKPIYQNLNGPQPSENWRSGLQLSRSL